ncbi:MAG: hypothetical protein M1127_01375 [Patescibacteria group bacterium]|nr:hypothetical protein [Patescibacteria group bacterium]
MVQKINSKTLLSGVLNSTGAEAVLAKYRVPCLSCPMAQYEVGQLSIGDVCKMYSLDQRGLLAELNKDHNKNHNLNKIKK